jgi:hypothetical protein
LDIYISPFERAITNAVDLLTRTRFHKTEPFYLLKPTYVFEVRISGTGEEGTVVFVRCRTWGEGTVITLVLNIFDHNWLPWGPFTIKYGPTYPVASLSGKLIDTKGIYPMYVNRPDAVRHQELAIRSRAR